MEILVEVLGFIERSPNSSLVIVVVVAFVTLVPFFSKSNKRTADAAVRQADAITGLTAMIAAAQRQSDAVAHSTNVASQNVETNIKINQELVKVVESLTDHVADNRNTTRRMKKSLDDTIPIVVATDNAVGFILKDVRLINTRTEEGFKKNAEMLNQIYTEVKLVAAKLDKMPNYDPTALRHELAAITAAASARFPDDDTQ